jgi:ABC-type dipeptide/oligopeptide/nickel transport system permease subunit
LAAISYLASSTASRITLYIVGLVVLTAPVFGLLIGTVAGYFGGWTTPC